MKKTVLKIIKVIFIILGIFMFFWFAAPVSQNILNIGNVFGMLYFGVLAVALIMSEIWIPRAKNIWQKTAGKITVGIFSGAVIIGTLYMLIASCFMFGAAVTPPAKDATVVVLGCKVNGEELSLMLSCRLEAAYDYLEENPSAKCVVSGGQGYNEGISEAECMYRWLVEKGIDKERIYKEDKSVNTEQNIRYSAQIIKENGLNSNLAIVTDGFHELRASIIAKKQGYSCGAVSADTPLYLLPTYAMREMFGLVKEFLF